MKKNAGVPRRRIRGLGIVRLPRVVLLAIALVVPAGIPLAIPGPASAQQPVDTDLTALEVINDNASLPADATSAQAGTTQSGTKAWDFFLVNNSQASVTNPTITINSGWGPSLFPGVSSFPVTASQASLAPGAAPGDSFHPSALRSDIPVDFTLGYDSTRTVSPGVIPVGGAQQTLTVTVTPIDPRYQSGGTPGSPFGLFHVIIDSQVQGVSVVSTTGPGNLNDGEQLASGPGPQGTLFAWTLGKTQTNKTYTFTAVLNIPNTTGAPFTYTPGVGIDGEGRTFLCPACLGSAVTVADATLDGNVPGSGHATFSVADTSHMWTSSRGDSFNVYYQGTTQTSAIAVTTTSLPGATPGSAYSTTLAATGGTTPYTWSVSSGALPPGLSLNASTGVISGTPVLAGTFGFTVQAADSSSPQMTATANLSITVGGCATTITGTHNGPLTIGSGVTCLNQATVTGPVKITAGAVVSITGSALRGPLSATGPASLAVCGSTISGPASVSNAAGLVLLGGTSGSPCGKDAIGGPVTLAGNTGGVVLAGNTISGPASITANSGGALVAANTIGGPLSCSRNNPPPADGGQPNKVSGPATGQCSGLA